MSVGPSTAGIKSPSAISVPRVNYELLALSQIIEPHSYKQYVDKYGLQNFTLWLSTFGGKEKVEGREFFHFESQGKLMIAVTNKTAIVAPAAGASVTITLAVNDHLATDTSKSPIRVGETVKIASSGIEGKVISVNKTVNAAHTAVIRPLRADQAFVSAGSADLLANEVLKLQSNTEAGEASTPMDPQVSLDDRITNTTTEIREDWTATDRAEMEKVYYDYVADGGFMSAGINRGKQGAFTYKGLVQANRRFLNNKDFKLLFGDIQNNTGLNPGTVGTKGLVPEITTRSNAISYTAGTLNLAKMHTISALMDVNGNPSQNMWLMDIFQRQAIDDTLFAQYPQGAYVWGSSTASEEASVAYGFDNFKIDNYMLQFKKYAGFNTEVTHGKTPTTDQYRDFGIIIPQGSVSTKYGNGGGTKSGTLKNVQVMYQEPMGGGTVANGTKVWEYGGAADENLTGTMEHKVSMIAYEGIRAAGLNQFFTIKGS